MDCIDAAWLLFVPPEGWGKKRNSFLARQKQSIANPERWRKGDESLLSGEFWFLSRTDPSGGEERTRAVLALWQEIDRCCKELCSMNKNFVTSQSQVEASFENLRQAKFYEDCCQEVQDALALAEQVKSEKKKK